MRSNKLVLFPIADTTTIKGRPDKESIFTKFRTPWAEFIEAPPNLKTLSKTMDLKY